MSSKVEVHVPTHPHTQADTHTHTHTHTHTGRHTYPQLMASMPWKFVRQVSTCPIAGYTPVRTCTCRYTRDYTKVNGMNFAWSLNHEFSIFDILSEYHHHLCTFSAFFSPVNGWGHEWDAHWDILEQCPCMCDKYQISGSLRKDICGVSLGQILHR